MDWFLRIWIPIAVAVTGLSLVAFLSVQQLYRQSLNDPQVQIAEDIAYSLENGASPQLLVGSTTHPHPTDIATSLRAYTVIYDKDLRPLAWNGTLNGAPPAPPSGVFAAAKNSTDGTGENRVSWQPEKDVRSAIVVVHVVKTDGYVLSGRNMRETEARIWNLQAIMGIAWVLILCATLVCVWIGARISAGKSGVVW